MAEIARVVSIGKSLYFAIAPRLRARLGIKAGDRMIVETDGRQLYCAPLKIDDLIRLAPRIRKRADGADGEGSQSDSKKGGRRNDAK